MSIHRGTMLFMRAECSYEFRGGGGAINRVGRVVKWNDGYIEFDFLR